MNLHRIEISEVEVRQVRPLRTRVLRPWFDDGQMLEYGGDDGEDARHFAAFDTAEGRTVGVVSYLGEPLPVEGESADIRLRGMAVAEDLQRVGIGSHLLSTTLSSLAVHHPDSRVWAAARISVTEFYVRHGFEAVGPLFEMPSVGPHQRVVRDLPAVIV